MANRNYSNTAVATTITSGVTNTATALVVASTSGYPVSFPFTCVIDQGTATEELVSVTAATGLTFTVTRGHDGSPSSAHSTGAAVKHVVSAQDFREPQDHIAATSGVHGRTGALVGTTDIQALTNKDLSSPTNTMPSNVVTTTGTQVVTNKDMSSASNIFPGTVTFPTGAITMFGGTTAPGGWLLLDGSATSRSTNAALFALFGTTYGAGDGSTTFNLPDMRGRSPLGAGTGAGLTARTRGASGGVENAVTVAHAHSHGHTASTGTESADHIHSGSTGGRSNDHSHALGISDASGVASGGLTRKGGIPGDNSGGASADHSHAFSTGGISANHTHTVSVVTDATSTGVSGTGANMTPFLVLNFIVKT